MGVAGYRVGKPQELTAWKVLDYEYSYLGNEHIRKDVARFLRLKNLATVKWPVVLRIFKSRFGDARGIWVVDRKEYAKKRYGEEGGPLFLVEYVPWKTVINMPDGKFVLEPERIVEAKGNPSGNHTYCRLLLKEVMADVRKLVPGSTIKAAWPYIYPSKKEMKQAEFQIPPEKFYWNGQACCKASAAYQGWRSYLRKKGLATNPGKNGISKKASGGLSFGLMVGIGFIIYAIVKGREE